MKNKIMELKLIKPKEQCSDSVILFARFNMVTIPQKKKTNKQYELNVQRECQIIRLVLWHLTIYFPVHQKFEDQSSKAPKVANLWVCKAGIASSVSSGKFRELHSSQSLQSAFASEEGLSECRRLTQWVGELCGWPYFRGRWWRCCQGSSLLRELRGAVRASTVAAPE